MSHFDDICDNRPFCLDFVWQWSNIGELRPRRHTVESSSLVDMASAIASTTALSSRTSVRGGASIASRRFAGADTTTRPLRRPVTTNASGMKVAVTGAGGRTGSLCMKLLAESANFATPRGLVRSDKSAAKVKKLVGGDSDDAVEVVIGDVSDPSACDALVEG